MEDLLPPISKDLLDALDRIYPERSPSYQETEKDLLWRGGQRSVVRFLTEIHSRQNESILSTKVL